MPQNLWQGFLEDMPSAGYFSYQNQPGRSPNQKRYFQQQFNEVQQQYMGRLGEMIRGGQEPTVSFTDYLSQYFAPGGGEAQAWAGMSPRQRGTQTGGFSPPTRWRF